MYVTKVFVATLLGSLAILSVAAAVWGVCKGAAFMFAAYGRDSAYFVLIPLLAVFGYFFGMAILEYRSRRS